jgi:hypothetical protein
MEIITVAAVGAGTLQAVAYALYIRSAVRHDIDPNPTTWLMWAYGTALLVVVEHDQDAGWHLLLLPVVCTACCLLVAGLRWRRGTIGWPRDRSDQTALWLDLALTAGYLTVIGAGALGYVSARQDWLAKSSILLCVNASTFVSFWPIVRSTRENPSAERWHPWGVWSIAYALLGIVTIAEEGITLAASPFWIYPTSCMVLSGLVGWHASRPYRLRRLTVPARFSLATRDLSPRRTSGWHTARTAESQAR